MSSSTYPQVSNASSQFNDTAQPVSQREPERGARRETSPLVIRLTKEERARLEELAVGMTLSAYVRACVFGKEAKRRKRRPKDVVADKKAAAEALALLRLFAMRDC